jgi:uncharacterized protein (DUF58 family)
VSVLAADIPYLDYAVRWRSGQAFPGRHAARASGQGGDFSAYRPFWQLPDARRIDVRRSIVDPFDDVVVRQTDNRSSLTMMVAADLSRSMQASEGGRNLGSVAMLAEAAARSAHRAGDAFGFVGFDEHITADLYLPPSRARGAAADLVKRLRAWRPAGRNAEGIAALAALMPPRKCLLVLVSDFLLPIAVLEQSLLALARHDVAPVVLHDARERAIPAHGVLRLQDAETGRTRLLIMRPALRRRWQAARAEWRAGLDVVFLRHCRTPFHVEGALDIARLGEHLRGC